MNLPSFDVIMERALTALPAALLIIFGAFAVRVVLERLLTLITRRSHISAGEMIPVRKVLNWLILGVTLILLLGVFGFDLNGLWTMLSTILAMIAIGFVAVWSLLSNVSCSFLILFSRPFMIGDHLEFVGEAMKGRVIDVNFIFTTLEAEDGSLVQVPNNLFFQKSLKRRKAGSATPPDPMSAPDPRAV